MGVRPRLEASLSATPQNSRGRSSGCAGRLSRSGRTGVIRYSRSTFILPLAMVGTDVLSTTTEASAHQTPRPPFIQ
jgi:hypothetical protein